MKKRGYHMIVLLAVVAGCVLLYFIATMPATQHKKCFFDKKYYAHRGLHDESVTENTLTAFDRAAQKGYGIELDVRLTRDGHLVVFHDDTLKRLCGREEKVICLTWAELEKIPLPDGQQIPGFDEVLQVIAGRVPLLVEIKSHRTADCSVAKKTWEMLKDYAGPYMVQSFDPFQMRWFKKHAPEVIRGQLAQQCRCDKPFYRPKYMGEWLAGKLLMNRFSAPHFVSYRHEDRKALCYRMMRKVYRPGLAMWTVRSQAEVREIKNECDVIIFEGFQPE